MQLQQMSPSVVSINCFPVKSMRGQKLQAAHIETGGIRGDRQFVICATNGRLITARAFPELVLFQPSYNAQKRSLTIYGPEGGSTIHLPLHKPSLRRTIKVWKRDVVGYEVAKVSDFRQSGLPRVLPNGAVIIEFEQQGSFFDDGMLLLMRQEDIAETFGATDSNAIDRFRPNIVVQGLETDDIFEGQVIKTADAVLQADIQCPRCAFINVDPLTGHVDPNWFRQLADKKANPQPKAGWYCSLLGGDGLLSVGCELQFGC